MSYQTQIKELIDILSIRKISKRTYIVLVLCFMLGLTSVFNHFGLKPYKLVCLWLFLSGIATTLLAFFTNVFCGNNLKYKTGTITGLSSVLLGFTIIVFAYLYFQVFIIDSEQADFEPNKTIGFISSLYGLITVIMVTIIDYISFKRTNNSFYQNALIFIDLPILLGTIIISIFVFQAEPNDFEVGFGGGAIAMQLIIGNVSYGLVDTLGMNNNKINLGK